MASNEKLLEAFSKHAESDQKFQQSIDDRLKKIEVKVDAMDQKLSPLVQQDERVQWAAKKVVTVLKVCLLVLSIAAAIVTIFKTGMWR